MLIFSLDAQFAQGKALLAALRKRLIATEFTFDDFSFDDSTCMGEHVQRQFPDGESYLNIISDVAGQDVVVLCQLHHPNNKLIELMLFAETVKQQGAKTVSLVAPYLAYMRQDKKFQPGECITSRHVSAWLNERFDSIITIDPHLHRYHQLNEIYSIPNAVLHATDLMADYIRQHITRPLIIGPDSESEQWANAVAQHAGCESIVLTKVRNGDHDVEVSLPELENYPDHQPVLIDDIISTGKTMIKAAENIVSLGGKSPICICVHPVFAEGALEEMQQADIAEVISCDTIIHKTNKITVVDKLAQAIITMQAGLNKQSHFQFDIPLKAEL